MHIIKVKEVIKHCISPMDEDVNSQMSFLFLTSLPSSLPGGVLPGGGGGGGLLSAGGKRGKSPSREAT